MKKKLRLNQTNKLSASSNMHELAFIQVDATGLILLYNELWAKLIGFSKHYSKNKNVKDLFDTNDATVLLKQFTISTTGKKREILLNLNAKDRNFLVMAYIKVLKPEGNSKHQFIIHFVQLPLKIHSKNDINTQFVQHVYERSRESVFLVNKEGHILTCNSAATRIFKYTKSELLTHKIYYLISGKSKELRQLLTLSPAKLKVEYEMNLKRSNGQAFYAHILLTACREKDQFLFCINDISQEHGVKHLATKRESMIKEIIHGISTKDPETFLQTIVLHLNKALAADYTFIALCDSEFKNLKTIANCYKQRILTNISFQLKGTPCNEVLNNKACYYSSKVTHLFPEDQYLKQLKIEGYIGIPIYSSDKKPIGILVSLYRKSIAEPEFSKNMLELMASNIALELEHRVMASELSETKDFFKLICDNSDDVIWMMGADLQMQFISPAAFKMFGFNTEEMMGLKLQDRLTPESYNELIEAIHINLHLINKRERNIPSRILFLEYVCKDRSSLWTEVSINCVFDTHDTFMFFTGITRDISERKQYENHMQKKNDEITMIMNELSISKHRYQMLFNEMNSGFALHKMIYDNEGKPVNYIFLDVNPAFEKLTGLKKANIVNRMVLDIMPDTEDYWIEMYGHVAKKGEAIRFENFAGAMNKYFEVTAFSPEKDYFATTFNDITYRIKSQKILQESESKYRSLIDNTNNGVAVYLPVSDGTDFLLMDYNLAAENMSGIKALEVTGRKITEVFPETENNGFLNTLIKVHNNKIPIAIPPKFYTGSPFSGWYETFIYSLPSNEIVVMFNNVNERIGYEERIKQERDFSKLISETSPVGILCSDMHGNLIFINKQATELFRTKTNATLNIKFSSIDFSLINMSDQVIEEHDSLFYKVKSELKSFFDIQYKMVWKEGIAQTISINASPILINNGQFNGVIMTIDDISDRAKVQQDLLLAKTKAEESDRLKSAFLANMSHEIRTPMNAILGFSDLLTSTNVVAEKQVNYKNIIRDRCHDLLHIVNDILDISRIESGEIEIYETETSVNTVIRELKTQYESKLAIDPSKFDIHLNIEFGLKDEDDYILTDDVRVKQILSNLLENAIKFTHEGTIKLAYYPPVGDQIHFYVSDTGIGIAKEQHKLIFERFRQSDEGATRKYGGNGLGLSIVNGFVNRMNGQINLDSEVGIGTTFHVILPYKRVQKNSSTISTSISAVSCKWQGKKILIIEDDKESREYLSEVFSDTGVECTCSGDGITAIHQINNNVFDLVLLDIQLPDYNGIDVLKKIRTVTQIPVIAQTAYAMADDRKKYLDNGFTDYISKPINAQLLFEIVDSYIGE